MRTSGLTCGATGIDTEQIDVLESVKPGDNVRIYKHPLYNNTTLDQERERVLVELRGSDIAETDTYTGVGITENTYKPMEWTKQKTDMVIKGDFVSKGRDTIKALVYPTAHIIQDVPPDATSIFVDDAQFFNYEFNNYNIAATTVDALIVDQGTCRLEDGTLAGASLPLLEGCKRLARWSGEPSAAIWSATMKPRHLFGKVLITNEYLVGKSLKELLRWQFNFEDYELSWQRAA